LTEQKEVTATSFANDIILGPGGLQSYMDHEVVDWTDDPRVTAVVWTLKCLANPDCVGSAEALAAIMKQRNQKNADAEFLQELKDYMTTSKEKTSDAGSLCGSRNSD
jgi:hypothetical protein